MSVYTAEKSMMLTYIFLLVIGLRVTVANNSISDSQRTALCTKYFSNATSATFADSQTIGSVIFSYNKELENATLTKTSGNNCQHAHLFNINGTDIILTGDLMKDCEPVITCGVNCNYNEDTLGNSLTLTRKFENIWGPVFKKSNYSKWIKESFEEPPASGKLVINLYTEYERRDCAANHYSFSLKNNFDNTFQLDDSGKLELMKQLDYESNNTVYELNVVLKDDLHRIAETKVILHVEDVDDMDPKFDHDVYNLNVTEGNTTNFDIWLSTTPKIYAEDQDRGEGKHDVVYKFQEGSMNNNLFTINRTSGMIKVNQYLDRETRDSFSFIIRAVQVNTELRSATATLNIKVLDINDNLPKFETDPHEVQIAEHSYVGSRVTQVSAHDKDEGKNAEVVYRLQNNQDKFDIGSTSGVITVKDSNLLDRETQDVIELQVAAIDKASNVIGDSINITIRLLDMNDNSPIFAKSSYVFHANVTAVGMEVGQVHAKDKDAEGNGLVSYFLFKSPASDKFSINNETGVLTLRRIMTSEVSISVEACDNPENINSRRCTQVLVEVTSSGNFTSEDQERSVRVMENSNIGTIVDSFMDGNRYTVIPNDTFSVTDSGLLQTKRVLDRESEDNFNISVYVFGFGNRLIANVSMYIKVIDANDNMPQFTEDIYNMLLMGNEKPGKVFGKVQAQDRDEKGNNSKIEYSLKDTVDSAYFLIDKNSGNVSLSENQMPGSKTYFQLTVIASDCGDPVLSSSTTVYISRVTIEKNQVLIGTPLDIDELEQRRKQLDSDIGKILKAIVKTDRTDKPTDPTASVRSYMYISAKYPNNTDIPAEILERMVLGHMNEIEALFAPQTGRCSDNGFGAAEIALIVIAGIVLISTIVAILIIRRLWDKKEKYVRLHEALTRRSSLYESQEIKIKVDEETSDYNGSLNTNDENSNGNGNHQIEMNAFQNPVYADDETQLKAVEAINEAISHLDHAYQNEEEMENRNVKTDYESVDTNNVMDDPTKDYDENVNIDVNTDEQEERVIQQDVDEPVQDYESNQENESSSSHPPLVQNYENVDLLIQNEDVSSSYENAPSFLLATPQNKESGEHEYANTSGNTADEAEPKGDEPQPDYNVKQVRFSGEVLDTDENKIEPLKEEKLKKQKKESEESDSEAESSKEDGNNVPPQIFFESDDNEEPNFKFPSDHMHMDESDRVDEEINSPTNFLKPEISDNTSGTFHFPEDIEVEVTPL